MAFSRILQILFGVWLLIMFVMTGMGWRPPAELLSAEGVRWAEVNLRPDMMAALLVIYGIGAGAFLSNRYVALGAAVQAPLAVNMAMYHVFVNKILLPGGVIAAVYCLLVLCMLWFNRRSYRALFQPHPSL